MYLSSHVTISLTDASLQVEKVLKRLQCANPSMDFVLTKRK